MYRFSANYEHVDLKFIDFPYFSDDLINTKLVEILELSPDFIYLDVSENSKELYQLGQFIKRINKFILTPVIALVDEASKMEQTLLLGFDFAFVKGGEMHDVVFHPYFDAFPKEALGKNFARAKMKEKGRIKEAMRVGYYTEDVMHIECDSKFSIDDIIKLETQLPKDLVKTDLFTVKKKYTNDLYYSYKYAYDLEYKLLPDLVFDEEEMNDAIAISDARIRDKAIKAVEEKRQQKIAEHQANLKQAKKKFKAWIDDNKDNKKAKKTKILVIDEKLNFMASDQRKLDSFAYTLRVQTNFCPEFKQIDHDLPQLIVYEIPPLELNEEETLLSDEQKQALKAKQESRMTDFFAKLVEKVKSINNYSPFIIIFNCLSFSSKAFQDTFRYDLIIANNDRINLDLVIQMAELYEKKQQANFDKRIDDKILELRKKDPAKYGRLTKNDFIEAKYYVGKNHKLSKAYYEHEVVLRSITESEVALTCDSELEMRNYFLETPFKMVIKIVPIEGAPYLKEDGSLLFKGLIHSIGEREKKALRKYINDIYTSHKTEDRKKEEDAFKELNKKREQEMLEKELEKAQAEEGESKEPSSEDSRE